MRTIGPIQFLFLLIISVLLLPVLILLAVCALVYARVTHKNLSDILRERTYKKSGATQHSQGRIIDHE